MAVIQNTGFLPTLNRTVINPLLQGIGRGITNTVTQIPQQIGNFFSNPQNILGAGLIGQAALQREPGEVTEARQFLRNQFTSPYGLTSQFQTQLGALGQQFEPALQQGEKRLLDQVQQRAIAGRPTSLSTAMGGPEIQDLRSAIQDTIIPQRQAFYGNLALDLVDRQTRSAGALLQNARPDPLREALGQLGAVLLGGRGGTGTAGGPGGVSSTTGRGPFGTIFDVFGNQGGGQQLPPGWTRDQRGNVFNEQGRPVILEPGAFQGPWGNGSGGGGSLPFVLSPGQLQGFFGDTPLGGIGERLPDGSFPIYDQSGGAVVGRALPNGAIVDIQGQQLGSVGGGGLFGPLGTAGGLLQGVGTGAAGFGAGNLIGRQLPDSELGGAAAGAAGGAASGALIGSFLFPGIGTALGATLGALGGAGGGFLGSRGAAHQEKAAALAADLQSARNTVSGVGSFWQESLGAAGYQDPEGFYRFVQDMVRTSDAGPTTVSYGGISGYQDQDGAVAYIGSQLLLRQIQQNNPQIQSLDQVPGFRDRYIQHILNNTYVESGGSVSQTSDISQKAGLLRVAGL